MRKVYIGAKPFSRVYLGGKPRQVIVGCPKSLLPNEYAQLEYIESTGTQYIDTGIYCTKELSVSVIMQYTSDAISQHNGAILKNNGFKRFHFGVDYEGKLGISLQDQTVVSVSSFALNENIEFYISSNENKINNSSGSGDYSSNLPETLTCWLFNRNANFTANQNYCHAKLFKCEMWMSGEYVRDFIPAKRKSDGMIGLYDLVSGTFFTDANGGNFTGGDEV